MTALVRVVGPEVLRQVKEDAELRKTARVVQSSLKKKALAK